MSRVPWPRLLARTLPWDIAACILCLIALYYERHIVFSRLIALLRTRHDRRPVTVFRTSKLWSNVPPFSSAGSNHAHPNAAHLRCQATTSAQKFCDRLKSKRYDVSTSSRELKWDVDGDRLMYDMSDVVYDVKTPGITYQHVVTMIDVDYYVDNLAIYAPNPILMYTVIPECVAGQTEASIFYYESQDVFVERVTGGAEYKTQLWDFTPDRVILKNWFSFTIYVVEKALQPGTTNRYLVLLCPTSTIWLPWCVFKVISRLGGFSLSRAEVLKRTTNVLEAGGVLIGRFVHNTVSMVSIKLQTAVYGTSVNIPEHVYDSLVLQKLRTAKYLASDIERSMNLEKLKPKPLMCF